jgi:hypothetical protein
MDADDTVVGTPDFSQLSADAYYMRLREIDSDTFCTYWRPLLFRDGMRFYYVGVVHEYPDCDDPCVAERLEGEYYVESRRLGGRNLDPQKYARDRDLLLAEVERNPDDARSVFYLAHSYFHLGDFTNARKWDARRVEMGGWDEEVYYSMLRGAESMSQLGEPWPDVQDTYLRAWEFRPTRAEALYAIACRYDADTLTGACAAEDAVRRAAEAGRYVLADVVANGPAMFETARLDRTGGIDGTDPDPIAGLGRRAAAAGLRTASLDEVLCIAEA